MSGRVRKYLKDKLITDIQEFAWVPGNSFIWWRHKPMHVQVLRNMSFNLVCRFIGEGHVYRVKINPEWEAKYGKAE